MTKRRRLVGKSDADFPVDQDTVNTAVGGIASLSAAQEISDVEDLSEYDLDSPQNEIKLTTDDGDTVLQIGMENESTSQYYVKKSDDDKNVYLQTAPQWSHLWELCMTLQRAERSHL